MNSMKGGGYKYKSFHQQLLKGTPSQWHIQALSKLQTESRAVSHNLLTHEGPLRH